MMGSTTTAVTGVVMLAEAKALVAKALQDKASADIHRGDKDLEVNHPVVKASVGKLLDRIVLEVKVLADKPLAAKALVGTHQEVRP